MPFSTRYYEELFTREFERASEEAAQALRNPDVVGYRRKITKSGDMLECDIYPIWKTNKGGVRAKSANVSRKAQSDLNDKNARKRVVRTINANFDKRDIWATFTYDTENLPATEAEALNNMQNYIKRLRRYIKKKGLPELKYIYVTEYTDEDGHTLRVHHHIVMNFQDRDKAEAIWNKGGRTQTRRLQPDDYGLEGLARYITKQKADSKDGSRKTSKRYSTSLNLIHPEEHATIADKAISKRRAMNIALNENSAKGIFEKMFKGYLFNDIEIKTSQYVSGVYLYVRMRKAPGAALRR